MDFESQIEKIAKYIRDREDKELALAFTNVVGSLLRENGVFVKTSRYEFETDNEADKNKYIIKKEYRVSFDGLDFTEHDKVFEDKIELLNRNLNLQKDKRCEAEIERNYLAERFNQLKDENDELKQRIAEFENENKNLNIRIFQNEIEKEKKNQVAELKSMLESIRMRCHESARDSFDLGNYGCLHIVTADELKTTKDVNDRMVELPFDALETANMLINATYKRENCMTGTIYDKDIYDIDDLEQIAEHLLVYCKHNREDE